MSPANDNKRISKAKLPRLQRWEILILGITTFLGFCLRIFQLGRDDFWIDEAGVAFAAMEPTISKMLAVAHNHVMAMPLDYMVAWAFGQGGINEVLLRFPAVIWGTLTLPILFFQARRLVNTQGALLATLCLAVLPIHIQYSQEARFYASLVFFYWLSNLWLLKAIEIPTIRNWILFTVFTIVGIYFHVFVILCLLNGVGWLWLSSPKRENWELARLSLVRSYTAILLAFLVALFVFGSVYTYEIPLLLYETSIWKTVGLGLGFFPFYPSISEVSWVYGILLLILAGIGVVGAIITKPRGRLSVLLYSSILQGASIILLNILKNYFLAPRQFLIFLPIMLILAASGADVLIKKSIGRQEGNYNSPKKRGDVPARVRLYLILTAILLATSAPAIHNYYQGDKGKTCHILELIEVYGEGGDPVFLIPDFKSTLFAYYAIFQPATEPVEIKLIPTGWETIESERNGVEGKAFLVLDLPLGETEELTLRALGFQPLYIPENIHRYSQGLWMSTRVNSTQ